jgi:hypothetical protein
MQDMYLKHFSVTGSFYYLGNLIDAVPCLDIISQFYGAASLLPMPQMCHYSTGKIWVVWKLIKGIS